MKDISFDFFINNKNDFLKQIKNLIILVITCDKYWNYYNNNALPKCLIIIKNMEFKIETLIPQLKDCIVQLKLQKFENCLLPLYDYILSAIDLGEIHKESGEITFKRIYSKYDRYLTLIIEDINLVLDPKNDKKFDVAKNFYKLGSEYLKLSTPYYNQKALVLFTNALNLINPIEEMAAYILRERAFVNGIIYENPDDKIKDLEEAYKILYSLNPSVEDKDHLEKAQTFLRYGEALLLQGRTQEAIKPLLLAICLRPELSVFLIAGTNKLHQRVIEHIKNFNLPKEDQEDVLKYLTKNHWLNYENLNKSPVSLWLVAAGFGSSPVLTFVSGHANNNVKDENNNNPIHLIAREGHADLLDIVSKHANYSDVNNEGLTPFAVSVKYGNTTITTQMLVKGVNPIIRDTPFGTIDFLSFAIKNGKREVLEALLRDSTFIELCDLTLTEIGKHHCISQSQEDTSDKNYKLIAIWNLCQVAISENREDMFQLILNSWPEVLTFSFRGLSVLQYAARLERTGIIKIIVYNMVDLDYDVTKQLFDKASKETNNKETIIRFESHLRRCKNNLWLVEHRRSILIQDIIEQFKREFIGTAKTSNLTNEKNIKKLTETLEKMFHKKHNNALFLNPNYENVGSLKNRIVKQIIEKIKTKEITMNISTRNLANLCNPATKKFNKEMLGTMLAKEIIFSTTPQPKEKVSIISHHSVTYMSKEIEAFSDYCEIMFDDKYCHYKSLANKTVLRMINPKTEKVKHGIKKVANGIPEISGAKISVAVDGAIELLEVVDENKRDEEVRNMLTLFGGLSPIERTQCIRYTIEQIAYKFSDQIHNLSLGPEGIEKLAKCAIARIVDYIVSSKNNQIVKKANAFINTFISLKSWVQNKEIPKELSKSKLLYDIFLDGLCRIEDKFPEDKLPLATINKSELNSRYTPECIFQNVGIITPSGERYANENTYINEVGYIKGSKDEAEKRGLTLYDKDKKLWGAGRQWEPMQCLDLSKQRRKQSYSKPQEERGTLVTKGEGDCAFHATFGKWNSEKGEVICDDVASRRTIMAKAIKEASEQNPIFPHIVTAIQDLILTGKEELLGLSNEQIKSLNDQTLKKLCKEQAVRDKYANHLMKEGTHLLPCELYMIAEIFKINIKYYDIPENISHNKYNNFTPKAEKAVNTVGVCFNGTGHFEQVKESYWREDRVAVKCG